MPDLMKAGLWSRLRRGRSGLGAIEFGFVAPVLLAMLLGVLDFGMAFWEQMQVANAADAGAQWGMSNSFDASNITNVVKAATNLSIDSNNINASNPYGCPTSSGITTYSQSTTCPDGSTSKQYIVVTAHICYSTIFSWPGLSYCSGNSSTCSGCGSKQISLSAQSVVLTQ
jgi:Flp pilus assembly protein TadG